jgi:hypothetical protein
MYPLGYLNQLKFKTMKVSVEMFPHYSEAYLERYGEVNPIETIHKAIVKDLAHEIDFLFDNVNPKLISELHKQSIDAIVYACLEYAKFSRPYSEQERLEYLLNKCKEFNGMLEPYHMAG